MVNWRRNLAALWLAEFTAIFGFSFAFPFLPAFLHRELGISNQHDLAFWTGIAAGAAGLTMAVASPIWGFVADRYGRKPMLLRAMFGGGISVGLMGVAQTALQLTGLRLLQGALSGTVPAATAIVASQTPRHRVAWSLGVLSSAIAFGSAVGPAVGGLAGNLFGLRTVFLAGGVLLLISMLPVILVVKDAPVRASAGRSPRAIELLQATRPGTIGALAVLISGQALMMTSYSASQQLVALRLVQLVPVTASAVTGIAFSAGGIAAALAGISYSRVVKVGGYRNVTAATALLMAGMTFLAAIAPSLIFLTGSFVFVSFLFGALSPALTSMIGLETPPRVQATVYGVGASAFSIGFGAGPLIGGLVAASAGIPAGLGLAAAIAALLATILRLRAREPAAARPEFAPALPRTLP